MSDLKNAARFLGLFNHERYTLCYLSKTGGMRSFPCAPAKLPPALELLSRKNEDSEIYFMVNAGSGEMNTAKTACHSTKNVILSLFERNYSVFFINFEVTLCTIFIKYCFSLWFKASV